MNSDEWARDMARLSLNLPIHNQEPGEIKYIQPSCPRCTRVRDLVQAFTESNLAMQGSEFYMQTFLKNLREAVK
jgi:hypothetical protein